MTNLKKQKVLASKVAGVGRSRIKVDASMAEDLKEAITKEDIKALIKEGAIEVVKKKGVSRHRARERHEQRKKGRQRGPGRRKGASGARTPSKRAWINKIRALRVELKQLREDKQINPAVFRDLYRKAKGGLFRDRGHLAIYLKQRGIVKKGDKE